MYTTLSTCDKNNETDTKEANKLYQIDLNISYQDLT